MPIGQYPTYLRVEHSSHTTRPQATQWCRWRIFSKSSRLASDAFQPKSDSHRLQWITWPKGSVVRCWSFRLDWNGHESGGEEALLSSPGALRLAFRGIESHTGMLSSPSGSSMWFRCSSGN
jgi:hypothetical protein